MMDKTEKTLLTYKKKLVEISKNHTELERQFDAYYELFSVLVTRLANACKGYDIDLDQKLAKLRMLLQKNSSIDTLRPAVEDLNTRLKMHSNIVDTSLNQTQAKILEAGKKLQNKKGLPERTRRNLRALLATASKDDDSIVELLPKIQQLVDLYEQALAAKLEIPKSGLIGAADKLAESEARTTAIANQVMNLLAEFAFSEDANPVKEEIQETLLNSSSPGEILQCCIDIIRLIVDSLAQERKAAQDFLYSLNDALSSVHKALDDANDNPSDDREQEIGKELHDQVQKMQADVADATNLDSLKQQIQKRLSGIATALTEKSDLEQKERQRLEQAMQTIQSRLETVEKQAEQYRQSLTEQQFKSLQDSLTQLPNRASFDERIGLEFKRWQRTQDDLCIAIVDIDLFKSINDTYGHTVGDKTLQIMARVLKKSVRETDFVARYGGEEFVLVFPQTNLQQSKVILEKLRESVANIPFKFKENNVTITISAGVSQFTNQDTIRKAFDRADEALYQAKDTGRNRVVLK